MLPPDAILVTAIIRYIYPADKKNAHRFLVDV